MALLPKVKLKTLPTFPSVINGGTGIDATRQNGALTVDLDYSEFGRISALPANPNLYSLIYDTVQNNYTLAPVSLFGGGGGSSGIADAPVDGTTYARNSAAWVNVSFSSLSPTTTQGDLIYRGATIDTRLPASTAGYLLQTNGAGTAPSWTAFFQSYSGAINRPWLLKARETVSVLDFGAVGDGVVDCTAAFQAAFNALASNGGILVVPPGRYILNSAATLELADRKGFTFLGAGQDATIICFPTGSGFTINTHGYSASIHVRDMTITNGRGNDSDTAFKITQNYQCSVYPAREPPSDFTNVTFRGDDGVINNGDYWGTGIRIDNKSNFNVQIGYYGAYIGGSPKGIGIVITGEPSFGPCGNTPSYSVQVNVIDSMFDMFNVGIVYGTCVQGISIVSSNFTEGNIGIFCPANGLNIDQLAIVNSQFGGLTSGVLLQSNLPCTTISNSLFIVPTSGGVGIQAASDSSQFIGNTFAGMGAGSNNGLLLSSTIQSVITGNVFADLGTGIGLQSGTSHVNVQSNSYRSCTTTVANLGTSNAIGGGSS